MTKRNGDRNNKQLKLSIIIPAFNAEKYLCRCLDSIEKESDDSLEVIVVNDGSSDSTSKIVIRYIRTHPRLNLKLYNQSNLGVASARNMGLLNSTGKFVMFVDSDDRLVPGWHKNIRPFVESNTDVISFRMVDMRAHQKRINHSIPIGMLRHQQILKWYCSSYAFNSACSRLFLLDFLRRHKLKFHQGVQIGEDALFMGELINNNASIRQVNASLYEYIDNPNSATHVYMNRMNDTSSLILKKYQLSFSLEKDEQQRCYCFLIHSFFFALRMSIQGQNLSSSQFAHCIECYWNLAHMTDICRRMGLYVPLRNHVQIFLVKHQHYLMLLLEIKLESFLCRLIDEVS